MENCKLIHTSSKLNIYEDQYGKTFLLKANNLSVVMLARDKDSLILIRQYRRPVNDFVIQLPGGRVESGEELEEAIRREFLEETGYRCGSILNLGYMFPSNWLSNEVTHLFYTEEILEFTSQLLEDHENIEVIRMDIRECLDKVRTSEINDPELSYALLKVILAGKIKI